MALQQSVEKFAEQVNTRFDNFEKRVGNIESDIQTINTRLDNLVKVNNLKE
jgi:chaperonin cofactor prefoldin